LGRSLTPEQWLSQRYAGRPFSFEPASEDASFRRYFRVISAQGSAILMDAPPEHEDCRPFVKVAGLFGAAGVHVPTIMEQDLENGYLLLSDLGNRTYLQSLNADNAAQLYDAATSALVAIQLASRPGQLPEYDRALLQRELQLFPDWYVRRQLGVELNAAQTRNLSTVFERILANNLAQPRVFVHRDYHSRNLMLSSPNPGILDFQDAVYGPVTYDLVSLFKDAYMRWEEDHILDWTIRFWTKAKRAGVPVPGDFASFYQDFEWMGVQRHVKVLGIFARLFHRDGKSGYLKDMPLVMDYLRKACSRYQALDPLTQLLDDLRGYQPAVGYTL
jgi:aminoglycoside/choline kinase family phosphotransferase